MFTSRPLLLSCVKNLVGVCRRKEFVVNRLLEQQRFSYSEYNREKNRTEDVNSGDAQFEKQLDSKRLCGETAEQLFKNAASFEDAKNSDDVWTRSVYPRHRDPLKDPTRFSFRPAIDPSKTSIILFPGQGVHFVGMGQKLLAYPNVMDMYEIASEILGYDLLYLCSKGPESEIQKTAKNQPAILVASLAAVEKLRVKSPEAIENCIATAGFSIGEYAALVFAGALSFEDAVRLIKIRGEAMQIASELAPSGMMTVFYGADAKINFACLAAQEWCIRRGIADAVCSVANYLFPCCKVIAGNDEALKFIELNASDFGIKRLKRLPVSGAFHTQLMKPAKDVLFSALKSVQFNKPLIPVHSNLDGKPCFDSFKMAKRLAIQLCAPVKWEQTLHILYSRDPDTPFPKTFECGPGNTMGTILYRINKKAWANYSNIEV